MSKRAKPQKASPFSSNLMLEHALYSPTGNTLFRDAMQFSQMIAPIFQPLIQQQLPAQLAQIQQVAQETLRCLKIMVLSLNQWQDPIDIAIYFKISCALIMRGEMNIRSAALNNSKSILNYLFSKNILSIDIVNDPLLREMNALYSYIPMESFLISIFFDDNHQIFTEFKATEVNFAPIIKKLDMVDEQEIADFKASILNTRTAVINYSEDYFQHHHNLIKLCEQQGVSQLQLIKRQKEITKILFSQMLTHPLAEQNSLIKLSIQAQWNILEKFLHSHSDAKLPSFKAADLASNILGNFNFFEAINEIYRKASFGVSDSGIIEAKLPSILFTKPKSLPSSDPLTDIHSCRKYYRDTNVEDKTIIQHLYRAAGDQEKSDIVSFLLQKTNAKNLVDKECKCKGKEGLETALTHAARMGCVQNVKYILKAKPKKLKTALAKAKEPAIISLLTKAITEKDAASSSASSSVSSAVTSSQVISSRDEKQLLRKIKEQLQGIQASENKINESLIYYPRIKEQQQEDLEGEKEFEKFCSELAKLAADFTSLSEKRTNYEKEVEDLKYLLSKPNAELTSRIDILQQNIDQYLLKINTILEKIKYLPILIDRAKKNLEQRAEPKAPQPKTYPKKTLAKPIDEKKERKEKKTEEPMPCPVSHSYQSTSLVSSSAQSASPKKKCPYNNTMLFWHIERLKRRNKLNSFCDLETKEAGMSILLQMQVHAILRETMLYMEIQKNPACLPEAVIDLISEQLGETTIRQIRNALTHSYQLLMVTDLTALRKQYLAIIKFGKLLSKCIATRNFLSLQSNEFYNQLVTHGQKLDQQLQQGQRDIIGDTYQQLHYLFYINSLHMQFVCIDEKAKARLPVGMQESAIAMAEIRMAKYCQNLTGTDQIHRRSIVESTHLATASSPAEVKAVEEQLKTTWSARSGWFG